MATIQFSDQLTAQEKATAREQLGHEITRNCVHAALILLVTFAAVSLGTRWAFGWFLWPWFPGDPASSTVSVLLLGGIWALLAWVLPTSRPVRTRLGAYSPVPDIRFTNALYVGSGGTAFGAQPGELYEVPPHDHPDAPMHELVPGDQAHAIVGEEGLFPGIHLLGVSGSGKSDLLRHLTYQIITKHPVPPPVADFDVNWRGKIARRPAPGHARRGGGRTPTRRPRRADFAPPEPYMGLKPTEAERHHDRLASRHATDRWTVVIFAPDAEASHVERCAQAAGRSADVIRISATSDVTLQLFGADPAAPEESAPTRASRFVAAMVAAGQMGESQFYREQAETWLGAVLELQEYVNPAGVTFQRFLDLAIRRDLEDALVEAAEARVREAEKDLERRRRLGVAEFGARERGIRTAINLLGKMRTRPADERSKQVASLVSVFRLLTAGRYAELLNSPLPPTFPGFDACIREGRIVVVELPVKSDPIARLVAAFLLLDLQRAVLARSDQRIVAVLADELPLYATSSLTGFLAQARKNRCCFVAAHQSLSQFTGPAWGSSTGVEGAVTANLTTKLICQSPTSDGAAVSSLLGRRPSVHRSRTVSGRGDALGASWSESRSATDTEYFAPHEVTYGLKPGQLIARISGGTTDLGLPRRVEIEKFTGPPDFDSIRPPAARSRHSVAFVARDEALGFPLGYLDNFLDISCLTFVQGMKTKGGELAGVRLVNAVGSMLVRWDDLESHARDRGGCLLEGQQLLVADSALAERLINSAGGLTPTGLLLAKEAVEIFLGEWRSGERSAADESLQAMDAASAAWIGNWDDELRRSAEATGRLLADHILWPISKRLIARPRPGDGDFAAGLAALRASVAGHVPAGSPPVQAGAREKSTHDAARLKRRLRPSAPPKSGPADASSPPPAPGPEGAG